MRGLLHDTPALIFLHRALVTLLAGLLLVGCGAGSTAVITQQPQASATAPAGTPAQSPPRLVVRANSRNELGPFDAARLLNVAVGGSPARANSAWLPGAYEALAEAGIRRVRIDHLTDDRYYRVVSRNKDGLLAFDFSRLDAVLLPLLEGGIEPFLCLSYTPGVLSADGALNSLPELDEWQQVVRAFASHYLEAGYSGLHWEVWNEPDREHALRASAEQYLDFYRATAGALRQVDPAARIGGPADSAPAAPDGRLGALLAAAAAEPDLALDFITYHKSGDSNGDGLPPFDLEWGYDILDFAMQHSGLPPREVYVTGWNLTSAPYGAPDSGADDAAALAAGNPQPAGSKGRTDILQDSHMAASAAAVKLYNVLKYPNLSGVFYAPLIDGYDPRGLLHGEGGLLTVNYHRKALYQLFQMISWMGDEQLDIEVRGEETRRAARYALVTRAPDGLVAVLAWNNTSEGITLDLAVDGLPASGNWQVVRYQIDAQHAGYLNDFQAGVKGLSPSPSEQLVPLETNTLPVTERYERVTNLPSYSVALFLLAPPNTELPGWATPTGLDRNLAAGQVVTVSSSLDAPGWFAEAAVDEIALSLPGSLGWSSALAEQDLGLEWITVDLGAEHLVKQVVLYPRSDQGHDSGRGLGDGFPADFRIQSALLPNQWRDMGVYSNYGQAAGPQVFNLSPTRSRYIRVMATRLGRIGGRPGEFYFQLAELQVVGE